MPELKLNYKTAYIVFFVCFSIVLLILLKAETVLIRNIPYLFLLVFFVKKLPGTYVSTSRKSLIYRFLRDVFIMLNGLSFALYRTNQSLNNTIIVWIFLAFGIFFYHQYLQCNQDFIEKNGKFFLMSVLTIIIASFSLVLAVYDFFWRSRYTSSIMLLVLGIICVGLAIIFNKKNIEYLSKKAIKQNI